MFRAICVDALNPHAKPSYRRIRTLGANGVRQVVQDDQTLFAYLKTLKAHDVRVAALLARESFLTDDYASEARYFALEIEPDYWVLGNEEDAYLLPAESPSSWKMRPDEYGDFFARAARGVLAVQPDATLVMGGMVSGQPTVVPDYIAAIQARYGGPIHGVDVHPYAKNAEEARALLTLYREQLPDGMHLYVFEWNQAPRAIAAFATMLDETVDGWAHFCWSSAMDQSVWALTTAFEHPLRSYTALHAYLRASA